MDEIFPILASAARPCLTKEDFAERLRGDVRGLGRYQHDSGVMVGDELRAIAGFRPAPEHGDDRWRALHRRPGWALSAEWRSAGYGAVVWSACLEGVAIAIGVDAIRLDSAVHRLGRPPLLSRRAELLLLREALLGGARS